MPLGKNMNYVNRALSFVHYGIVPFLPYYMKFVHTAIELNLGCINILIEYGCYLSKKSKIELYKNITDYQESEKDRITYYYPFDDGISFYVIESENIKNFYKNYKNILEKVIKKKFPNIKPDKISDYIKCCAQEHYTKINILKDLQHISIEESIQEIFEDSNHVFGIDLIINTENRIKFGDLINNFASGWKAENYNLFNHNCQNFVAEVIDIIKAYRREHSRKLIYETEIPIVVLEKLKNNENNFNENNFNVDRILEKIPLVNLYYLGKVFTDREKFKKSISNDN